MFQVTLLVIAVVIQASSMVQAGYLDSQLVYNARFPSPLPCGAEQNYNYPYGAHFAAPLPVAPVSDQHPYAAVGYSTSPVVKFRSSGNGFGFGPFNTYASVRSHHKFAFPAPVPSIYNAPPPINFDYPEVSYSGFETPKTVVKFGAPITTTTTSYSTTAAATAGLPVTGW